MIICFACERETKKLMDSFLSHGDYGDYGEVISVAVKNLHMIQTEVNANGSVILTSGVKPQPVVHDVNPEWPSKETVESRLGESIAKNFAAAAPSVPQLFRRPSEDHEAPELMQLPDDVWVKGNEVPLHRWLFAMYNKLLPAKANCRALCNLAESTGNGVELGVATESISKEALLLGNYLVDWDSKLGLNRDSLLATAFPTSTKDAEKSISRYGNQFVANLNKYGQLSGLLFALKLINYKSTKRATLIHLTEPGRRFALIENPVLDSTVLDGNRRFSDNEIDFLLEHIANNVPAEHSAYHSILKLVCDEVNTPDAIDQKLQAVVSEIDKKRVSLSYLVSQRSGAVSRMSDLDIIRRVRDGVAVTYVATPRGIDYLASYGLKEE